MSCATLEKARGKDWHKNTKLSLGGVWDGALERFLKVNPQIKRICFCTDADGPGKQAAEQYTKKYAAKGYNVSRFEPTFGKDFNNMLVHEKNHPIAPAKTNVQMR
jgi:hypothetical protein